jgi:DnaJ-class molecular chaperone
MGADFGTTPFGHEQVLASARSEPCATCGGDGWLVDHSRECYARGECVGCDGVQVQCSSCGGSGRLP